MRVRYIFIALMSMLVGCGGDADIEGIKQGFADNKSSFERLYLMIKEDTSAIPCFSVGADHIGEYWRHNGKWNTNRNYERKISLAKVLEEVGLSDQRYQEYLSLFEKTGSNRISYCPKDPSWARIIVHSSGLSVSGCLTSININGDQSVPVTDVKPSYSSEITPLGAGWYISHDCT
ncbi:hypothetical protein [Microbulbifer sp. SAOS-129_SWC]|uniref:hypothetical protein n=1 Tax=Microbulbifer sp. SAOS-129_SWC TaxID=3145235 RepID=UPI0032165835